MAQASPRGKFIVAWGDRNIGWTLERSKPIEPFVPYIGSVADGWSCLNGT